VLQYETESIKKEALACMPLTQMESNAAQRLRNAQIALKSMKMTEDMEEPSLQQMLLLELLSWFKNSFFTWVDTLPCFFCSKETESAQRKSSNGMSIDVSWNNFSLLTRFKGLVLLVCIVNFRCSSARVATKRHYFQGSMMRGSCSKHVGVAVENGPTVLRYSAVL